MKKFYSMESTLFTQLVYSAQGERIWFVNTKLTYADSSKLMCFGKQDTGERGSFRNFLLGIAKGSKKASLIPSALWPVSVLSDQMARKRLISVGPWRISTLGLKHPWCKLTCWRKDRFTTSRLVGVPPGYVGYKEGGQFTAAVRTTPILWFSWMRWRRLTLTYWICWCKWRWCCGRWFIESIWVTK